MSFKHSWVSIPTVSALSITSADTSAISDQPLPFLVFSPTQNNGLLTPFIKCWSFWLDLGSLPTTYLEGRSATILIRTSRQFFFPCIFSWAKLSPLLPAYSFLLQYIDSLFRPISYFTSYPFYWICKMSVQQKYFLLNPQIFSYIT